MNQFFHILNPSRVHKKKVQKFFEKNPSLDCMWIERISHPTHLETVVQWAVNEGRSNIAVWGGDGTLSRVAQALYDLNALEKMTVVLVPAGTCNDFARKLRIPYWKKWAQEGFPTTQEKWLDLGLLVSRYGHRIFVNNSGFGRMERSIQGRSNPVRDIFSLTEKKIDLEWTLNGSQHFETRAALLGIVFNAPYFNGGMHFDKTVEPSDGELDIFLEDPQPRWGLLLKFLKSKLGVSLKNQRTFSFTAQNFRLESNAELFPQVDGEQAFKYPVRSLEFEVLPKRLHLLF